MEKSSSLPPPWQVLDLISHHLDPKTLAKASTVSKSWHISMSSDHLWHAICSSTFPSLSNLHLTSSLPYSKLYSLGRTAVSRRLQTPLKPHISLSSLLFAFDIYNNDTHITTILKPGVELNPDKHNLFRFDIYVDSKECGVVEFDASLDNLTITWTVVLGGFKGVFTMMECKGKGSFVMGLEGWFSKELPNPGCCCSSGGSGMVADLKMGMRDNAGKVVIEKMCVGVLSVVNWRFVCVDDALRYLQHFLLPVL